MSSGGDYDIGSNKEVSVGGDLRDAEDCLSIMIATEVGLASSQLNITVSISFTSCDHPILVTSIV